MQHPTCTNIRIRSVSDAHKIFHAVQHGILQMVTRRLDADERMQLRTGCVYAWEERGPHTELTGLGIERFTEGRRWSPSRVRDEFLFYYEKYSPSPECANPHPPRDWDPLVKQTYSVWVETDKGRRKWHLTAYFTQATVDQLGSIDDMRVVRDLVVPEDMFKSTRVTKGRSKNDENRAGESSKATNASTSSRYAPFPAPPLPNQPESSGQILMFQPYVNHDASASRQHQIQDDTETVVQRPPAARSSNPNLVDTSGFRDLNKYHTQAYRPLLPSTHPRNPADHLHRGLREYNSISQQVPVRSNPDVQHPSASLPQARPENEVIPSSDPSRPPTTPPPSDRPSVVTYHSNVNAIEPYTPNVQPFPASASGWAPTNPGTETLGSSQTSSVFYGDSGSSLTAQTRPSYPAPHNEIDTGNQAESYHIMPPYLNLVHEGPGEGTNVPRENLPPLSILQEAYCFSYDFSVAMVSQSSMASPIELLDDAPSKPSASTSEPSQQPKPLGSRINKPNGTSSDLELAPLNTLSRRQPYRREPMDDRALRLLWPRSP
ncbi:hypothetical protein D9756_007642 [Leucocoprinus leucothites]|uniref:cAMP-independent regulatory protein pac2 n=1 Tax=Leucocoprinus leucothites TaxID=201217 RepID=A0A8H5D1S9_9AGAR|nr:hypothetical protein D9756_007642 [Leucoagaricus leucothites]